MSISKTGFYDKASLYWYSFCHVTGRQRYYWILNRGIKPLLPWHKNGPKSNLKCNRDDLQDKDFWPRLYQRIRKILYNPQFAQLSTPTLNIDVNQPAAYRETLLKDFGSGNGGNETLAKIKERWFQTGRSEEDCSYHRFHLFHECLERTPNGRDIAVKVLESWLNSFPKLPVCAFDPFNCALRVINWLKLASLFREERNRGEIFWRLLDSMAYQARLIYRNIEYEIDGNHVLLELYSLWLVGMAMPPPTRLKRMASFAENNISREIIRQFDQGGFHREHSMHYHIQSTLIALNWLYGMQALGKIVNPNVYQILQNACHHITASILPDGTIPVFGDKCHSLFYGNTFEDIQAMRNLSDRVLKGRSADSPITGSYGLGSSYYIYKNPFLKMIIDIGNIGDRGNPGHGHSDMLSFVLCSNSSPIIIDAGTRSYHDFPEGCPYKKATYHNTLSIDGNDQAYLWGNFRWAYLPDHLSHSISQENEQFSLIGQYRGFKHIGGFTHRRTFSIQNRIVNIVDNVIGKGTHDLTFSLILHPAWHASFEKDEILLKNQAQDGMTSIKIMTFCEVKFDPILVFPEYNAPVQSSRITLSYRQIELPFAGKITIRVA